MEVQYSYFSRKSEENDEYKICLHAVALSTRPALIKTIWLIQFRNKKI